MSKTDGTTNTSVEKPYLPYVSIDFHGKKLFAHKPFKTVSDDETDHLVVGCSCETFPVKSRLETAMQFIADGDIKSAVSFVADALREINEAELLNMPYFQPMPVNAVIDEDGELKWIE
jgi:hypothetical protein